MNFILLHVIQSVPSPFFFPLKKKKDFLYIFFIHFPPSSSLLLDYVLLTFQVLAILSFCFFTSAPPIITLSPSLRFSRAIFFWWLPFPFGQQSAVWSRETQNTMKKIGQSLERLGSLAG